jgi:hypothetical protein
MNRHQVRSRHVLNDRSSGRIGLWRTSKITGVIAAVLVGVTMGWACGLLGPGPSAMAATAIPTARTFKGVPAVGAVFLNGTASPHTCSASLIRSDDRDIVLTSAHCLAGNGKNLRFAPGYHDGVFPFGVWRATSAYVDPRWASSQDPQRDYVFLVIAPRRIKGKSVHLRQLVTGYLLGVAPAPGQQVRVVAYRFGFQDRPITCTVPSYRLNGYPGFDCHGYVGGTSGAPWITVTRSGDLKVRGIIGGLNQGGCFEYTSYSSRFDRATIDLFHRAVAKVHPDTLPRAGSEGC